MKTEKIHFPLEVDEDGYPPISVETLNGRKCDDGTFELMNVPFFIQESAYGDIVDAKVSQSGRLEFVTCVKPSTYKSISVIIFDPSVRGDLINHLQGRECIVEYGEFPGFNMLAIAIPGTVDYAPIKAWLQEQQDKERLSYAELVA